MGDITPLVFPDPIVITNTTPSINASTGSMVLYGGLAIDAFLDVTSFTNGGALTVIGGAAIGENLQVAEGISVGTSMNITASLSIGNSLSVSSGITTGELFVADNSLLYNNVTIGNQLFINSNVTFGNDVFVSDDITIGNQLFVNSNSLLNIVTANNIALSGINANIIAYSTSASTNASTGAIIASGGIASSITNDATALTAGGALTLAGGAAVAKSLYAKNCIFTNLTVTNFNLSLTNYDEFNFAASTAASTNATTTYNIKTSFTTASLIGGTYKVSYSYLWSKNNTTASEIVGVVDSTTLFDSSEHTVVSGDTVIRSFSGVLPLSSGVHTVGLKYRTTQGGTVTIQNAYVDLFRVA